MGLFAATVLHNVLLGKKKDIKCFVSFSYYPSFYIVYRGSFHYVFILLSFSIPLYKKVAHTTRPLDYNYN